MRKIAILGAILLNACGTDVTGTALRIDGTDDGSYRSSLHDMLESVDSRTQADLSHAIETIDIAHSDGQFGVSVKGGVNPNLIQAVRGRNAQEIINMATVMRSSAPY